MKKLLTIALFSLAFISHAQCGDTVFPTASDPADVFVATVLPAPDVDDVIDEADNSGVPPVVAFVSDVSDGLTCPEIITRVYSVTDTCGNSINVSHEIHIAGVDTTVMVNTGQMSANMSGASYQWLDCDNAFFPLAGETNQTFTPSIPGNYAVEVNNAGCIDTSACYQNGPLTIKQSDLSILRIFPSPTAHQLNVEFTTEAQREYRLYNVSGKEVLYIIDSGNSIALNVSELPAGMYILKVATDDASLVEQILIE